MEHTNFSRAQNDRKQLLVNVKGIIETIFLHHNIENRSNSVIDITNALPKLHLAVEKVFIHGIRIFKPDGSPDIWHFIEGLNWLNPALSISIGSLTPSKAIHVPLTRIKNDNALLWLYENLKGLSLSKRLRWLTSDYEHLSNCYEVFAFLRNEKFANALILCLQAIEKNQQNLLSQIDITLLLTHDNRISHKRCSSHPDFTLSSVTTLPSPNSPASGLSPTSKTLRLLKSHKSKTNAKQVVNLKLRPWSSLPNINVNSVPFRMRSKTISQPVSIPKKHSVRLTAEALESLNKCDNFKNVPSFTYKQFPSDSACSSTTQNYVNHQKNDLKPINLVKCDDIEIHFDRKYTSPKGGLSPQTTTSIEPKILTRNFFIPFFDNEDYEVGESSSNTKSSFFSKSAPSDFVNTFIPQFGMKLKTTSYINPTLRDDDGNLALPQSTGTGYFPRPAQGQSLASFLQIAQFSRTNTELDRENAHFSVAEAMISAMEQLKWRKYEKEKMKSNSERNLKDKKLRKTRKLKTWDIDEEKIINNKSPASDDFDNSNNESDETSNFSDNSLSTNDSNCDSGNLSYLKAVSVSTHSINDHVAYAEWGENTREALSAEGVALSLISKFSDKQLPRASDLLWLVSEQDAPQRLLPMPGSWTVNPVEHYNSFLRGTKDWAPPRAQIIFTKHPTPVRKKIMQSQNQRCAGCGMRVAAAFSHRFRYCEYLGKYHCTGCHRNQISIIPARVLCNWDFTNQPVSVFSYRLLNQIWAHPLFRVSDLNATLYIKIKHLKFAYNRRAELKFIKDFITTCRFAVEDIKTLFDTIPNYITDDIDIWSMTDFVAVKKGNFIQSMKTLILKCEEHIFSCELCTARGFLCELCPKKQIIFPWQRKVKRCDICGTCYHETCWKNLCAKCIRLQKRDNKI